MAYTHPYMLGRLPSKRDSRTLQMINYLPRELPDLPTECHWEAARYKHDTDSKGNLIYGNCVICTAANMLDAAKANESKKCFGLSDTQVINLSRTMDALSGYTILDRLKWWRRDGMWHSKIMAFASAPLQRHDLLKFIIWHFGSADIGVWMPRAWQGKSLWDTGASWNPEYRPGSWGGHSVAILGWEPSNRYKILYKIRSWGQIIDMTYDAADQYVDEIWAVILPAWYRRDKITPSGIDYKGLWSDLELLV